ncbi:MAG: WecB/TagA/CpsF family glycosyltransferase [Bacillota bacterium]|nr:WecB/TagA/CpsF family glycosyltransferase [Bacillota bacterium]
MNDKVTILGFGIDKLTINQAADRAEELLDKDGLSIIVTANPEILNNATKNEELADVIKSAPLVVPDGMSLVKLSQIKKDPFPQRVTGIDLAYEILRRCAKSGKKVFLLGAQAGVAEKAADNLVAGLPGLNICGTSFGYFDEDYEPKLIEQINNDGADLLIVAMGSPRQEFFLSRNADKLNAKLGIGVGGSLDVWSGNIQRAPQKYIDHNIEWLYRLKTEPNRFGRMIKIPGFMIKAIFDK